MKAIILLFFIISCQRAEINRHQEGLRQAEHESYKDDESIETLHTAIDNTKNKVPDELRFLDQKISKSDYQNTLSYLKRCGTTTDKFSQIIQENFNRYIVYGKKSGVKFFLPHITSRLLKDPIN